MVNRDVADDCRPLGCWFGAPVDAGPRLPDGCDTADGPPVCDRLKLNSGEGLECDSCERDVRGNHIEAFPPTTAGLAF